ncbi:MAG: SUMF1/EgtB/PvdO family nonheme iron enzyme [Lachnospiraceae bacterium]|nr:SUMF1/EgtB/PvdO family nonheme iron enzyme [Lachnospiraceae bacterium]
MDISKIEKNHTMNEYDLNTKRMYLIEKLGVKTSLFEIRIENNSIIANYLPLDLEFVYIPEGVYTKGLTVKEKRHAKKINRDIFFEDTEMEVEEGIFVSDMLVTRTPVLNSFVQKYLDIKCFNGEENFAAYLRKDQVDFLCEQLNLRLPTENEWEYFVRAGSSDLFSFGNQLPDEMELEKWLSFDFSDLNSINSNKFGLYGIYTGEWCSDLYKKNNSSSQTEGFVIKGGGAYFWPWQADEWIWCMSAMRMCSKGLVDGECGFRLVYDLNNE